MKKSGIAGSGTFAVLATQPKKMTSMHEKIAGGKFSNCASAIELGNREVSTAPTEVALDGRGYSREAQLGYDTWLVKGQPSRANGVESPDPKE